MSNKHICAGKTLILLKHFLIKYSVRVYTIVTSKKVVKFMFIKKDRNSKNGKLEKCITFNYRSHFYLAFQSSSGLLNKSLQLFSHANDPFVVCDLSTNPCTKFAMRSEYTEKNSTNLLLYVASCLRSQKFVRSEVYKRVGFASIKGS